MLGTRGIPAVLTGPIVGGAAVGAGLGHVGFGYVLCGPGAGKLVDAITNILNLTHGSSRVWFQEFRSSYLQPVSSEE